MGGGHRELEKVEKEQEQIITDGGGGGKEEEEETRQGRGRTKENKRDSLKRQKIHSSMLR